MSAERPVKAQALLGVVGAVVGRDGEHRRQAQPYVGFLLGGQALTEGVVSEGPRFLAAARGKQGHRPAGHQRHPTGCRDGANDRATLAMSAEALGSVMPSDSAASARAA